MYMAELSENIKFSEIADNEIAASENIYFTNPILTVTPEKSTTVNAIWNEQTPNQVDFDGNGDYLKIEDQTIEDKLDYDGGELVFFQNNTHNIVGPGSVSGNGDWSGYAVADGTIEYSTTATSGVEWNTARMTSGHQYSMVGFRTADDNRPFNAADAYRNMSYSVYTVDRSSSNETNIFDVRNQWQPDGNGGNGGVNTSTNILVTDSFDGNVATPFKMVVNPLTKKVELWHVGVRRYEFSFPLTVASYPIKVWVNVYSHKIENMKIINEKQKINNYISDKCWTFNCWIRVPAEQLSPAGQKEFLAINSVDGDGLVYMVGVHYASNITQLYTHDGSVGRIATNISADEWHMLTISKQPQETTTIYNPSYEYHSSNSIYGNNSIGQNVQPNLYHGLGQLDSPQAWVLPGTDLTNTAHNGGTGSVNYSRWWQIHLPKQKVFGTITQGRKSTSTTYQHVTKWKFKYSLDNTIWTDVDDDAEFTGNTDANTKVYQTFANPVVARYIRFYPQTYYNWSSARMGLSVAPLPGHISVYLDGQKDTTVSQGVNDNYISIPRTAKWSIGSGFSVATGTQITGPYITGGSKPVTHVLNLGNNIWIVGVIDGPYLKMIKIEITGENTYNYVATKYDSGVASACSNPSTFSEACFIGTESSNGTYVVNLVTAANVSFKGSAKEIMMWDKGLSDYEIAALHKSSHNWSGQTNIIEEDAVFTSSTGHNTVNGNSVTHTGGSGFYGGATTERDSSIVGITYQIIDPTIANVMVGLVGDGTPPNGDVQTNSWKGWKSFYYYGTGYLYGYYSPNGSSIPGQYEKNTYQTVTNQTVKLMINEDTNYIELYIDDKWVHTFNNPPNDAKPDRTVNIGDYPFACAVSCKAGGVKNVKVLKRVMLPRYRRGKQPFDPVFNPPYTHHSGNASYSTPGVNEYDRGRLSDNGAWVVYIGPGASQSTSEVDSNNDTYYYQIDYSADGNDKIPIAGVVTYGRNGGGNQWVTKWKFQYSNGSTWEWVDDGYEFDGNTHNEQRNLVYFATPVNTTGIRFFPTGYSGFPSARMALLLYKPNAPLYAIVDELPEGLAEEPESQVVVFNTWVNNPVVTYGEVSNSGYILSFTNDNIFKSTSINNPSGFECKLSPNPDYTIGGGSTPVDSQGRGSYNVIDIGLRINNSTANPADNSPENVTYSIHSEQSGGGEQLQCWYNGVVELGQTYVNWTYPGTGPDGPGNISSTYEMKVDPQTQQVKVYYTGSSTSSSAPLMHTFVTPLTDTNYPLKVIARVGTGRISDCRAFNISRRMPVFNGNNYLRLERILADSTRSNRTLVGKTNMSFSCWFYKINQGTDLDVIYSCHEVTTNRYIHKVNKDGSLWFYSNPAAPPSPGGEQWITRPGFIQTQKWYHYAFTRNGGTFTFYINGKKVSDDDIVTPTIDASKNPLINQVSHTYTTNYRFSIGQEWDGETPTDHWRGKINNIYFWDRTLTENEIYSVYHNFGVSKSEFAGKTLMDDTIIPEASNNANISISSYFKDKQFDYMLRFRPFRFTNCSATGQNGPTLTQCVSEYSDSHTRINMTTQGIQEWTVPKSGIYRLVVAGAKGGNAIFGAQNEPLQAPYGGEGAKITGEFHLIHGEKIQIAVGQQGNTTICPGGGGASWVVKEGNSLDDILIISGGGGGGGTWTFNPSQIDGQIVEAYLNNGKNGYDPHPTGTDAQGGTGGNGGYKGDGANRGGGGGGWLGDGQLSTLGTTHWHMSGKGWGNGLIGGTDYDFGGSNTQSGSGGFGGGGAGGQHSQTGYGGGGGGYSGGGGGSWASPGGTGGGGGSYINSSNLSVSYNTHSEAHGEVEITFLSSSLYHFSSHTFTNCGSTGNNGPTLANCISEYLSASWTSNTDLFNMTTQGIQEWTVPKSGIYNIIAKGGRGGHGGSVAKAGGLGAIIEGIFTLQRGEIIKILVGQKGQEYGDGFSTTAGAGGSGGGGTFVLKSPYNSVSSVLIIAGGGGGSNHQGNVAANAAQDINARLPNETGTGGGGSSTWSSGGGGGLITDGYGSTYSTGSGGKSFVNEGQGGIGGYSSNNSTYRNYGGFGGGGGNGAHTGGGGGGINGGDARHYNDYKGGEGGASYNTGLNQTRQHHSGSHGEVEITLL